MLSDDDDRHSQGTDFEQEPKLYEFAASARCQKLLPNAGHILVRIMMLLLLPLLLPTLACSEEHVEAGGDACEHEECASGYSIR